MVESNFSLTSEQSQALNEFDAFIDNPEAQVFILTGKSKTGKTFLIKEMCRRLRAKGKPVDVLAATGGSARALAYDLDLKDEVSTVHGRIYQPQKLNVEDDSLGEERVKWTHELKSLEFPLCTIIDTASFIGNREQENVRVSFGKGHLLSELLAYYFPSSPDRRSQSKLIFVGDPAQLNAIGETATPALDPASVKQAGREGKVEELEVLTFELLSLPNQRNSNGITQLADYLREELFKERSARVLQSLSLGDDVEELTSGLIVSAYLGLFPNPCLPLKGCIIAYSHRQCWDYNQEIRASYFGPSPNDVCPGDILLVTQNNNNGSLKLLNGSELQVRSVADREEHRIYIKGKEVILYFQKIGYTSSLYPSSSPLEVVVLLNSLKNEQGTLTQVEWQALYEDCRHRNESCWPKKPQMSSDVPELRALKKKLKQQLDDVMETLVFEGDETTKERYEKVCASLKEKEELHKDRVRLYAMGVDKILKEDPYFNALHVCYGYALTCHRALGKRWENVFVDYTGRGGVDDDSLRWSYTATTRASRKLYALNLPRFSRLEKMVVEPLQFQGKLTLGRYPDDFDGLVDMTPFHGVDAPFELRQKYCDIDQLLTMTLFRVDYVKSFPYQERYLIRHTTGVSIEVNLHYDKKFNFSAPKLDPSIPYAAELSKLLDGYIPPKMQHVYRATTPWLDAMYQQVLIAMSNMNLYLTQVREYLDKYYVTYRFSSPTGEAELKCYFRDKDGITSVFPTSTQGVKDLIFADFLERLQASIK